jgi:tetratricopeptide (TPR) repeat protein
MLEKREMSAEEFGKRFGQLTRKNKQPYTKSRIYQMVRDNAFPDDNTRRWVIATLLRIPPVLMGVESLDDLLPLPRKNETPPSLTLHQTLSTTQTFDIGEYSQALKKYWQQTMHHTIFPLIEDITHRIHRLEWEFLYGNHTNKTRIVQLLCGYHIIRANNARDVQDHETAIDHFNKAYTLAKDHNLKKLQTGILCRRGGVFKELGEELASLHHFDAAHKNFTFATNDFTLALSIDRSISPIVQGSISMSLGRLQADTATTPRELSQGIKKIDEIEKIVGQSSESYIDFIEVNEERYYLNRAAAYLASPTLIARYPRDARRELRNAHAAASTPLRKRRHGYNMILEATSSVIEGQAHLAKKRIAYADDCFGEATQKATEALVLVKDIHSQVNVARIEKLCTDLRATPFGKENVDVARLEVEITAAKFPHLFP